MILLRKDCIFLLYYTFTFSAHIFFVLSAVYYPGESSFEVKIEADSNEHPHDDKPTLESRG